jgi:hypothetical protein
MRPLRKCVTSPRMIKTEGLNTESFVKTIHTTMMNGMMISIMAILLLIMLHLWQFFFMISLANSRPLFTQTSE